MKHLPNHAFRFVSATAYQGYLHGLAQPCLQMTLNLLPEQSPSSVSVDLSDDSQLVPMPAGRSLRLSEKLSKTEAVRKHWPELQPNLELCHQWLVRVQESAGWPVSSGAVIQDISPLQPVGWTASLCFPSLHPLVLMQALPWLLMQLGDHRPAPAALKKAPRTLDGVLKLLARSAPPGTNTRLLLAAAYEKGVPVQRLFGSVMQYGWGCRSRWMDSSFTDAASGISAMLARDKVAAHELLRRAGFPVAEQISISTVEVAVSEAHRMGYPVVLKPVNLDGGKGVEAGLKDESSLRAAYGRSLRHSKSLILEKHVEGRDYRLGVLKDELAWATYREPAGVWGDGASTLTELITQANRDPRRGTRQWSQMVPITINEEAGELLSEQGLCLSDVVSRGCFVQLRRAANTSSGGVPMDVIDRVHPDNAALAVSVARLFRLDIAGIDFITPDISRSWREVGGVVCEVNGQPQFSVTRPDLPGRVLSSMVRGCGRVPVVLLLSNLASGPLTEEVTRRLQRLSINSGWVLADAMAGDQRLGGDAGYRSFDKLQALLLDTSVQAVLAATDGQDWLESGMPVDRVDLVVTDGTEDVQVVKVLRRSGVDQWWRVPTLRGIHEVIPPDFVDKLVDFIACRAHENDENGFE